MKKLWFLPALVILFASCRTASLPPLKTPVTPYVLLNDGKKYSGSSVGIGAGRLRNKISLDDTLFNARDVAFFSTGEHTYVNTSRKAFAVQVLGGKINLYRSFRFRDLNSPYYVQKPGVGQIDRLNYKNLKPMIERSTPEHKLLQRYKGIKNAWGLLLLCTVAAMYIGIASFELDSSLPSIFVPAVLAIIIEGSVLADNENKLFRVVEVADGFEPGPGLPGKKE